MNTLSYELKPMEVSIRMANGVNPSDKAIEAREAQARADKSGQGKEAASRLQSEADKSDLLKH